MLANTMTAKSLILYKKNLIRDYIKSVIKQNIFTGAEKITIIIE